VSGVVDDALDANEADAGDAEMAHQLLRMLRAEIRVFHHLLMLVREFKRQVILGQLLSLEGLLKSRLAERAEGQSLLLNFD